MALASDAVFAKILARLEKVDPNDRKVQNIYKFIVKKNGAVAKTWMLDLKAVKVYVADEAAECTFTVDDSDMVALGSGALPLKDALAADKLDIDGDMEIAMKLVPFVSSL